MALEEMRTESRDQGKALEEVMPLWNFSGWLRIN